MSSDPRRNSSAVPKKPNLRFVQKSKWELPKQKYTSHWKNIFDDMDARHLKVTESIFSLLPPSLTIPPESSVSISDKLLTTTPTPDVKTIMTPNEPIVKISPPSPSHNGKDGMVPQKSIITDSLEYLKSHDLSNFNLDLAQQKLEPDNQKLSEAVVQPTCNKETPTQVKTPFSLSGIGEISHLTKISRYVNDFLASTRVKGKSSISPKNYVHPQPELLRESPRQGHCIIEGTLMDIDNQTYQEEATAEFEKIPAEDSESMETPQKHVVFEDPAENFAIDSSARISRPRAPSLGVASLVPSFGRVISSLEYPDSVGSRSSIESPPDDVNPTEGASPIYSPILRRSPQTPGVISKNYLEAPVVHYPSKSVYPGRRQSSESRSKSRGYQHWPRRTIVNTIRALKTMKAGTGEKGHQKLTTFRSSPSLVQGHSIVGKSSSSSIEKSTGASDSSISSNHSSEQTVLRSRALEERLKSVPLIQKPTFRLQDLPPLGGMYQRKKRNKCLACMRKATVNLEPIIRLSNETSVASPYSSVITEFDNLLSIKFSERINKARARSEFTDDEISPLPEDQKLGVKSEAIDDLQKIESRPVKLSHLERKYTQSSMKDDLMSAKSFVSTLSLTSDQSRTISDQEDSDHGIDPVAEAGEELPGAGSKFRAPCHAPLNLKPSLEPLMALKGKKSKSIQSRSASLEKSLDDGSEEGSNDDDDEIEETAPKVREQEIKKVPSLKLKDGEIPVAEIEKTEIIASVDDLKTDKLSSDSEPEPKTSHVPDHEEPTVLTPSPERRISAKSGKASLSEAIYHQLNVKMRTTDPNPSHSFHPVPPMMSESETLEIARRSLDADKPIIDALLALLEKYSHISSAQKDSETSIGDHNPQKIYKTTNRLLALLIDSKLYLNPELTSSNLQFSTKQKPYCNSQQLRRYLPFKSYNLVAPILGMPEWHPKRWSALKGAQSLKAGFKSKRVVTVVEDPSSVSVVSTKTESGDDFDLIVHPPSPRESLDEGSEGQKLKKMNPYAAFISKPRRKVVIWRPLNERDLEGYDPDSMLKNRAAKVTDKICKDFCDWLRSLGGSHDTIDEDILKDMFETDFTAEACRTMRVCVKEMPMVPTVVAAMRYCPESGEPEVTRRQLIRDVAAERKPPQIVGFGSTVPNHLRYQPPRNNVHDKWVHCSSVPQDLETMSFVWKDIENLESIRGFSHWLKKHSQMKLPKTLKKSRKTFDKASSLGNIVTRN